MKTGILVTVAALGLALFAVPDAHGNGGADLHLKIFGGNHISSDTGGEPTLLDGGPLTAIQSGKSKGSGSPDLFSTAALAATEFENPPPGCPAALPFGGAIDVTLVFIYHDGSLLSLTTDPNVEGQPPTSFFCTDGTNFSTDLVGSVAGGNRRFEGSSGTWEGTSITFPGGRFTGEINVDLD
jgi:hypothetical protein